MLDGFPEVKVFGPQECSEWMLVIPSFLVPADRSLAAVTKCAHTHARTHERVAPPTKSEAVSNAAVT